MPPAMVPEREGGERGAPIEQVPDGGEEVSVPHING
jgi:hypothetical protein